MKRFEKLELVNSWESLSYRAASDGADPTIELGPTRVKFPDGTECMVAVEMKTFIGHYSDHGHESTVSSTIPVARINLKGIEQTLKLHHFEAVEFSAQERRRLHG